MSSDKKKYIYLPFVLIAFVALAILSYFFFSVKEKAPRDYPQIAEEGILRIVTNYEPFGYYVEKDSVVGFNHDLIELLKIYTNLQIEVSLESSLEKSIEDLEKNRYDLIARNIPATTRLKDSLSITEPLALDKFVLIQRSKEYNEGKEPIRSHLDLAEKTIYVPKKSPAILRVENLSREIGDNIHYVEDPIYDGEHLAMMVAAGDIDFSILNEKIALKLAAIHPELDCKTYLDFTHFEAWAVRNESPVLLDSLNNWISRLKNSPEYDLIYQKYYK